MKISLTKINLGLGNNPKTDWIPVLVIMVIVGVAVIYGAVMLFLGIRGGAAVSTSPEVASTTATLKSADITKYADAFSKRDADFETIRKIPYTKSFDPSK